MNIFRKFVYGVSVVFDILAPVDFRFGGFHPYASLVPMGIFLFFFFNKAPYGLADESVCAIVLAPLDPLPNQPLHFRCQNDGHFQLSVP